MQPVTCKALLVVKNAQRSSEFMRNGAGLKWGVQAISSLGTTRNICQFPALIRPIWRRKISPQPQPSISNANARLELFGAAVGIAVLATLILPIFINGAIPTQRVTFAIGAVIIIPLVSVSIICLTKKLSILDYNSNIYVFIKLYAIHSLVFFLLIHEFLFEKNYPAYPNIEKYRIYLFFILITLVFASMITWKNYESLKGRIGGSLNNRVSILLILLLILAAIRVFVSPVSTALANRLQNQSGELTGWFFAVCLLVAISTFLFSKLDRYSPLRSGWAPIAICLLAILVSITFIIRVDLFHAHPVVAPAFQLLTGDGTLLSNVFSQYGSGPVMVSVIAQLLPFPPFEVTAIAIQALTLLLLFLGCLLVILPLEGARWLALVPLCVVILASPMLLFGLALYNYPSLFLWRFMWPVLFAISFLTLHKHPSRNYLACGFLLGFSPFWSIEAVPISLAMIFSYFVHLVLWCRNWKKPLRFLAQTLICAAAVLFISVVMYLVRYGHAPRFEIQYEMISTYIKTGTWHSFTVPRSLYYVFPLVITSGYGICFTMMCFEKFGSALGLHPVLPDANRYENEPTFLSLHILATLTAIGTFYYIGRSYSWVLPGSIYFGLLFLILVICKVLGNSGSKSEIKKYSCLALFSVLLVPTLAITIMVSDKSPGERLQIASTTLVKGRLPKAQLKAKNAATELQRTAQKYHKAGHKIEVISAYKTSSEATHVRLGIPRNLSVSAYLSDSLSPQRRQELIAEAEHLPDDLMIITNTPEVESKIVKKVISVSVDIINKLKDLKRLCLLEKSEIVMVFRHTRNGKCTGSDSSY